MEQATTIIYREMKARLEALRRKKNVAALTQGALLTAVALLGAIFLALIAEQVLDPGVAARTAIFWVIAAAGAAAMVWLVGRPLLRLAGLLPSDDDAALARLIGRAHPDIRDRLVDTLELERERDTGIHYSGTLIDAAFEDLQRDTAGVDFLSVVDLSRSRAMRRLLLGGMLVVALLVGLFPSSFLQSAYHLWNFNVAFAAPAPFRLVVSPGSREIVKGESVHITVTVEGEPQKEITLATRPEGQVVFENRILRAGSDGKFSADLENVRTSLTYLAQAGDVKSPEYVLTVTDRPMVRLLRIELRPPAYTRLPARPLDDNVGDVTALKGTRIGFSVESNKELADARLVMNNDSEEVRLAADGRHASGSMILVREGTYHVALRDKEGTANADPIAYALRIVPDAYPTAAIVMPGTDLDVTDNQALSMMFKITDDFGFSRLRLAYRLVHSRYEQPAQEATFVPVPLPSGAGTEALIPYTWSLNGLRLVPEDVVSYYVEVFDNDNISGPKSAVSQTYLLRLPSLEEVFSDVSKAHDVSIENLQEALKQSEEAKKELDDLRQNLKQNQEKADWADRKKAEDLAKRYDEIQKKLEDANSAVNKMLQEMQKNSVLSRETLEKYQELQQMMEEMNSPEFAEAMKQLQQAMEQANPEAMRQAMEKFQFSEENFRKSIERTMNLLKRIQIEQKLDELTRRAEELMKEQKDLEAKTAAAKDQKGALSDLARRQRDLKEPLQRMQQEMEGLRTKMEQFPGEMPLKELQDARQGLDSSGLSQQMDDIADAMMQQQASDAAAGQAQAAQKMSRLAQRLQAAGKSLRSSQQREVLNQLRGAMQDLIELSKREEALKNESESLEQNSQRFRDNAEEQMQVIQDLNSLTSRLAQLSQKSFVVTPEMGKAIGDALRNMGESMQALDQRNGGAAGARQGAAMGSLNDAAQQVESAMQGITQGGGSGMGMAGFMQRLQALSGRQQGINKGTENLGTMSQQQAAEMARLAGEQGAVRKSLEELAREAAKSGDLRRILGNLNQIAQDMREVQTDLAQSNVNPETIHKQERILSRLLDSQLSARERDFEKRRRSTAGRDEARPSPPSLNLDAQEARTRLRNDLLRALEEGYAPDYQEVIKKYFEALEQSGQQQP